MSGAIDGSEALAGLHRWFVRHERRFPREALDAFGQLAQEYHVTVEHRDYWQREARRLETELKAARLALLDLDAGGHSEATETALLKARASFVGPVIGQWRGFVK